MNFLDGTYKIHQIWSDQILRKIFLDIITNTQLRKCKQLKPLIIQKMNEVTKTRLTDEDIYAVFHHFIHNQIDDKIRQKIQHHSRFRSVNRANKISEFIATFRSNGGMGISSVLDLGCGEGSITAIVPKLLSLQAGQMHGCDVKNVVPPENTFTYRQVLPGNLLPYDDEQHDVVYAFMSLHHIRDLEVTLREVWRTMKVGGMFIIREHDCVTNGLGLVLDVVHGFYSMVWSNPQEKKNFQKEYWARYRTADTMQQIIVDTGFDCLLSTHRNEAFPLFNKGKVINPLKHYYAIFRKRPSGGK